MHTCWWEGLPPLELKKSAKMAFFIVLFDLKLANFAKNFRFFAQFLPPP